jgi:hypothetical protein
MPITNAVVNGSTAIIVAMVHDVSRSPGVVTPDEQCRHDGTEG